MKCPKCKEGQILFVRDYGKIAVPINEDGTVDYQPEDLIFNEDYLICASCGHEFWDYKQEGTLKTIVNDIPAKIILKNS